MPRCLVSNLILATKASTASLGPSRSCMKFPSLYNLSLIHIFIGTEGEKTIVTLQAQDISGIFNPLGVALHRWEIDSVHIRSGSVMLQKTEAEPGASKRVPWPPWWGLFWPYRVHLADVKVDDANIFWKLRDKESGIYDSRLEITPNGRDFEYDVHGGEFKTPVTPYLEVCLLYTSP